MTNLLLNLKLLVICVISSLGVFAQLPERVLVGYWHNWDEGSSLPFLELNEIDERYNVICLSFAVASGGDPANMQFNIYSGSSYNDAELKLDIADKRAEGKVVLMSVGGATGSFRLTNETKKNGFVADMKSLIQEYGLDGIDIDLEQKSNVCMYSGTIQNPTDIHVTLMISALEELLTWYQTTYGEKMILTMAPETAYVQGGLSSYQVNNICGGSYLPIIEALAEDIDLLMVQLYNSGEMFDLDLTIHNQGTQGFITSQTEAVIKGFTAAEGLGTFSGLSANQIAVALPACPSAGSGYISPTLLKPALNYLLGSGSKVGAYTLKTSGGYPNLRGVMTWSINNDALANCGSVYEYAQVYQDVFEPLVTNQQLINSSAIKAYPNPASTFVVFEGAQEGVITDVSGKEVLTFQTENVYVGDLIPGIYFVKFEKTVIRMLKK